MHRRERCGKNCGKLRKIADINPGRSTRGIFFLVGGPRDPLEGSRGGGGPDGALLYLPVKCRPLDYWTPLSP